jgi:hypothetical protein
MSARITASLFGAALALSATAVPGAESRNSAIFILPGCRNFIDRKLDDLKPPGSLRRHAHGNYPGSGHCLCPVAGCARPP